MGVPDFSSRPITSTTSFARVAYFHYTKQAFVPSSNQRPLFNPVEALQTTFGLIEDAIESVSINKSLKAPSGTFDITLLPSKNWKQVVSPGDWLIIYFYRENTQFGYDNKDIVMIGNVDRVSRTKQKDEDTDKTLVRYHISGRDFGKVFEETDIFANPYLPQSADKSVLNSMLFTNGLPLYGPPTKMVDKVTDVFLSPTGASLGSLSSAGSSPSLPLSQWVVPVEMMGMLKAGGSTFHDLLNKKLEASLPGFSTRIAIQPGQSVGLWSYLMRCSNGLINELWTDLERDKKGAVKPTLYLRARPCSNFFDDKETIKSKTLIDLVEAGDFIELSSEQIHFSNLGRDDETYSNMIWLHAKMINGDTAKQQFANIVTKPGQVGLPMYNREYIMRYGLKKLESETAFVYAKDSGGGNLDPSLYKSFISFLYDIKGNSRLYETGTIEASGMIGARTGQVLRLPPDGPDQEALVGPPSPGAQKAKLYYVEGYSHEWKFPNRWTTTFTVTQGQFEDESNPFIDLAEDDMGNLDADFDRTSLVKTNVPRQQGSLVAALGNLGAGNIVPGGILT